MGTETETSQRLEQEVAKADAFRRVAGRRANFALDHIERLARTADRSRYVYTDRQVAEILGKLRQALDQLEAAYSAKAGRTRIDL